MTTDETAAMSAEPDSEGCLLVIAGYADIAPDLGPLTAEAAASIARSSPELGDFFEVRFVDIGPRPEAAGSHADAISLIAVELTRPRSAGRYYFALVVADRSAAMAEQLIEECQANPVIAALPMRYRGLATTDDRQAGIDEAVTESSAAEIMMPSAGAWDRVSLIHDLRGFAEQLLEDFAAGNEPGLTASQLPPADNPDSFREQPRTVAVTGESPRPQIAASSDVLNPQREKPHPPPAREEPVLWRPAAPGASRRPRRLPALWRGRHIGDPAVSAPTEQQPQDHAVAADQATEPQIAASSDVLNPQREKPHPPPAREEPVLWRPAAPAASRRPRRLPALWRGRHIGDPAVSAPAEQQPQLPGRLALLILLGDEDTDDKVAWRRGRSVMLQIDKKFADASQADYQVRTLRSSGGVAMSEPRRAGNLTRRDMRRPNASLDFPRILSTIRTVIKRDRVPGIADSALTQPIVIFFAGDVPLADAVTAEIYGELAHEASIIWIVPEDLEALLSPRLKEESAWVLPDHQAVADELIALMRNAEATRAARADQTITSTERGAE